MNEAERLSLEIRRKALEVFDDKAEELELQKILHLIERNQPDLLESVVKQLEEDNGRWSDSSGFPNAKVRRDANGRVQTVTFEALGKMQADGQSLPPMTSSTVPPRPRCVQWSLYEVMTLSFQVAPASMPTCTASWPSYLQP